ncbi:MAG: hypothetical protein PHV30_02460 [Candidatus Margulisbacteria bacterium]|nr:hypothetical protein [Candidatus Margulisiibacteriota bacterium]
MYNRRSIRLKGYDYTQSGAYFITLCTQDRKHLFGEIVNHEIKLNDLGVIAARCWLEIPVHYPKVQLDEYIIMPNHIHGILIVGESFSSREELSPIVRANNYSPQPGWPQPGWPQPGWPQPDVSSNPKGTSRTIGAIVRGYKIGVTKWAKENKAFEKIWLRNYYEHIIRNELELTRIRGYIKNNPLNWSNDELH